MNQLPKYLYAQGEGTGAGLILLNEPPFYVGKIIQFPTYLEMITQLNAGKFVSYYQLPGYSIIVAYAGLLGKGNILQGTKSELDRIASAMQEMGRWYLEWRIEKHLPTYKRFII